MKRTAIVGLNRVKLIEFLCKNSTLLIVTILYIAGILAGTMLFRSNEPVGSFAAASFNSFLSLRQSGSFLNILFNSFLSAMMFAGAVYITGTSVVGMILAPCVVMYRGFSYGSICSYLYSTFALKGIAFNAIILIPCSIIAAFGILLCAREAINFSILLARLFTPKGHTASIYTDFKHYCGKFLFLLTVFIFAAVVDAAMSRFFIAFFDF